MAKFPKDFMGRTYEQKQAAHEARKCNACNGSGYYDNTGRPKCGCCNGRGYLKT